jgi:hypothetical protein
MGDMEKSYMIRPSDFMDRVTPLASRITCFAVPALMITSTGREGGSTELQQYEALCL